MIDNKTIDAAAGKHYTDFSNKVKDVLHSKLANHEVIQDYSNKIDNIGNLKTAFNKINHVPDKE